MILDGKYQIIGMLGSGGMGEVFKVRHIQLNAVRTIKVLRSGLLSDDWYRKRFLREARLATQVHDEHVAIVHDFATLPNGSYYMVSEYIDGLTVRQWQKRYGPLPLGLAVEITSQVLSGLGHCHRRGLLHRDISPDNIMISVEPEDRPVAKIIDLGIAKQTAASTSDATQTGVFMGNPRYCSPEQLGPLKQGEDLDLRTDLYSMGVVLYEMVTGEGPYQSTTPQGFFVKHLMESPPPLKQARPDISWPEGFEAALFKALEKERSKRYRNAYEFAEALKPFSIDLSRGLAGTFGIRVDRSARDTDRTDRVLIQDLEPGGVSGLQQPRATGETVKYTSRREFGRIAEEERDWTRALADGSEESWRGYLNRHPDSRRREDALRQLSEVRSFKEAARVDSREAWETFLASWPQSRYRDEAHRRVEQAKERESDALAQASSAGSVQAYEQFLKSYGGSPLAAKARGLLEEQIAFEATAAKDTERSWDEFLSYWPAGRNAQAAGQRRDAARDRENEALRRSVEVGTSKALRQFLESYPEAKNRHEAEEQLREAVDFEAVDGRDTEEAWQSFLDRHPKSARRRSASRRLLEARAFKEAVRTDSRESWESFLATWPQSRRKGDAQAGVEKAKQREAGALEKAISEGSAAAFRAFLTRYPGSSLAPKASDLLEEQLGFDTAAERDTEKSWETFLARWPVGRNAAAAEERRKNVRRREEEALQTTVREGTSTALREFLRKYPSGKDRLQAEELLQEATAFEVAGSGGRAGWERFLQEHPQGLHAEAARTKLRQLETEALLAEVQEFEKGEKQSELAHLASAHAASSPVGSAAREALQHVHQRQQEKRQRAEEERMKREEEQLRREREKRKAPEDHRGQPKEEDVSKGAAGGPAARPRYGEKPERATPISPPPEAPGADERTVQVSTWAAAGAGPPVSKGAGEAVRPAAPGRRGIYIAVAASVLVAVAAVVWLARQRHVTGREKTEQKGAIVAAEGRPTIQLSPTAAPPVPMGLLVIDALPWGLIDRAEDSRGKNWSGGAEVYTPLAVAVPPGKYSVRISNPNFSGRTLALSAEVLPGERAVCLGRFEPIDPGTYLESQGWRP